jgi:hypothetical protein
MDFFEKIEEYEKKVNCLILLNFHNMYKLYLIVSKFILKKTDLK